MLEYFFKLRLSISSRKGEGRLFRNTNTGVGIGKKC